MTPLMIRCWRAPKPQMRRSLLQAHNNTPDQDVYFNADGVHSAKPLYFFLERHMESFIAEMKEFVQSIRDNTSPPVTGIDGRIPVVIGMAAKKSCLEDRPVRLSEITAPIHQNSDFARLSTKGQRLTADEAVALALEE